MFSPAPVDSILHDVFNCHHSRRRQEHPDEIAAAEGASRDLREADAAVRVGGVLRGGMRARAGRGWARQRRDHGAVSARPADHLGRADGATGNRTRGADVRVPPAGQKGNVFILAGDGPMIRAEVLTTLLQAHRDEHAAASMATAVLEDPTGYGRMIRDDEGEFVEIVEQVDCTAEQREIREVFPSYYCVKVRGTAVRAVAIEERKQEEGILPHGYLRHPSGSGEKGRGGAGGDGRGRAGGEHRGSSRRRWTAVMQDRIQRQLRETGRDDRQPR